MRNLLRAMLSMLLVACVATAVWSSEADELRAKAKAVQKEADQLAKEGRREEADKRYRAVKELLQTAEKHEQKPSKSADSKIDELHQHLKALAEKENALKESKNEEGLAELRKHRAAIEHQLAELKGHHGSKEGLKHGGKQPTKSKSFDGLEDAARRLKHIHIAIENLHAAGLDDVAKELAKRAEAMQHEIHQAHERASKEPAAPKKGKQAEPDAKYSEPERKHKPAAEPVDDLKHELQRLRAELNELREEIKKR
ncbi:MAG: hypothetical protein ACKV2Q_26630 [Planctomycetaceae bacterium]